MAWENRQTISWGRHVERWRGRFRVQMLVALLAAFGASCATYPKAHPGMALQVERGYWVQETQFTQRGKRVDRASAKQILLDHERSAGAAGRGRFFEGAALVTAIVSGAALGWGISESMDASKTDKRRANTLLGVGAGFLGVSIGFAIGADGSYVSAAELYNGPSTSKGGD
jgi:hypothetical protein